MWIKKAIKKVRKKVAAHYLNQKNSAMMTVGRKS
jgi:hypothetical protein